MIQLGWLANELPGSTCIMPGFEMGATTADSYVGKGDLTQILLLSYLSSPPNSPLKLMFDLIK